MEVQVRTDRHVRGQEDLISFIGFEVVDGLGPCAERVVSAHVHLVAETVSRAGAELRCVLEVRPRGHAPLAVTHRATTKDAAVRGAVSDMRGVLERMFRRIDEARRRGAETIRRPA
jgi:hypothetical protein